MANPTTAQIQAILDGGSVTEFAGVTYKPGSTAPSQAVIDAFYASYPASIIPFTPGAIVYGGANSLLTGDANFTRDPTTGAFKLYDLTGTSGLIYDNYAGRKIEITDGTNAVPVTTIGSSVKISRRENFTSGIGANTVDNEANSALAVYSENIAASIQQVGGIFVGAVGRGTNDAVGVYSVGRSWSSGNGTAYFGEGRRESSSGKGEGMELHVTDNVTSAGVAYNHAGQSILGGLWMALGAPLDAHYGGAAVAIGAFGPAQGQAAGTSLWDAGFVCVSPSVRTVAFVDHSNATSSFAIGDLGTHSYGFDANAGTFTSSIMRLNTVVTTANDGQIAVQMNPDMRLTAARTTIYGLSNIPLIDSSDGTSGGTMGNITSFANGSFSRVDTSSVYTGTITNTAAFHAGDSSKANGSAAITNEYGFYCDNLTIGSASKAAFYTNINASTGASAFFAAGTAISVFTGALFAQGGINANAGTTTGLAFTSTQTPGASNADSSAFNGIVATGTTSFGTHITTHVKAATKTGSGTITNDIGLAIDMPTIGTNNYNVISNGLNGENYVEGWLTEQLTLSTSGTTTDTAANLLPANSIILAVTTRITTAIVTATNWSVGDPTTAARFSAANSTLTSGTAQPGINQTDGGTAAGAGMKQAAAAKVRITTTGTPSAGVVRISVNYRQYNGPTA